MHTVDCPLCGARSVDMVKHLLYECREPGLARVIWTEDEINSWARVDYVLCSRKHVYIVTTDKDERQPQQVEEVTPSYAIEMLTHLRDPMIAQLKALQAQVDAIQGAALDIQHAWSGDVK